MLIFGCVGLFVDCLNFYVFYDWLPAHDVDVAKSLNMGSAWFHLVSDTLRSVSTITVACDR
eukprot:UN04089